MKRIISLLISVSILLTGCNKSDSKDSKKYRLISQNELIETEHNGFFTVTANGRLDFADFDTLTSAPVCDDPTCKHEPPNGPSIEYKDNVCSAYGKNNHPFIYNEKIYYLKETDYYSENDKYYQSSELWQSGINGDDNKKICILDKLILPIYSPSLLYDGTLYMLMTKQPYDSKMKDLEPSIELISVNLEDGQIKNYGTVKSSYSVGGRMIGVSSEKILFEVNYPEMNMHFMDKVSKYSKEHNVSENDAMRYYTEKEKYYFDQYEIDGDSFKKCEKQNLFGLTKMGFYYAENDTIKYIGYDHTEKEYPISSRNGGLYNVGDYLHIFNNNKALLINEKEKECYELKELYDIVYIKDEAAVVRMYSSEGAELKKIPVEEMIK